MTHPAGLLALIAESALGDEVDRVAAAAGVRAIHLDPAAVPTRKTWLAAAAIVLDAGAARCCAAAGLPRRHAVFVCCLGEPAAATLQDAISLGAQDVLTIPDQADELVRGVGTVGDPTRSSVEGGVVAVVAGRGGAGASLFAAALAHQLGPEAGGSLLLDLDPWGGGIDLLLGAERLPGLRWPELAVQGGRLSWPAVRDALPHHRGIVLLSGTRTGHDLSPGAVDAVLDASRRGGVTAVCDVPRRLTDAACITLEAADLVVLITPCDVRACAATSAMLPALTAVNPNVGLVVRGPAPGGLRPRDNRGSDPAAAAGRDAAGADDRRKTRAHGPAVAGTVTAGDGGPAGGGGAGGQPQCRPDPDPAAGRMSESLIERVRERLAADARSGSGTLPAGVLAQAIRAESAGLLGDTEVLTSLRTVQTELTGAGVLEPLLSAPGTTDVLVTSPEQVWVDDGNGLRRSPIRFADEAAVRRLAQRLAVVCGRRLDDASPWVDGLLTGVGAARLTVRLHAVLAPVAVAGTCISLRVLRPASQDLAALCASGAIAAEAEVILRDVIDARLAFLVSGGTGAGKTTLLSAVLGAVDGRERIVCVEDAAELAPPHPHLVTLVARSPNVEGAGEITVRQLVRQALRMRPDRIVVGEVRGAEVVDLLAALNTGHDGGAGTVHANSPAEVPARLEALGALGGLDRAALHSQLAAAVKVLLHVGRGRDGMRRLTEIAVLRRPAQAETCRTVTAWQADRGHDEGAAELQRQVAARVPR